MNLILCNCGIHFKFLTNRKKYITNLSLLILLFRCYIYFLIKDCSILYLKNVHFSSIKRALTQVFRFQVVCLVMCT